jgi:hypothetical protein
MFMVSGTKPVNRDISARRHSPILTEANAMKRMLCVRCCALVVCLAGAVPAQAWDPAPIRIDFTFRFDVQSDHRPPPAFPWWTYFPYDPHLMQPGWGPADHHWGPDYAARARQPAPPRPAAPAPNVVWQPRSPTPVRPVSYHPVPAAGFAFDR